MLMKNVRALFTGLLLSASFAACDKDPVGQQNDDSELIIAADSVVVKLSESSPLTVTVRNASGVTQYVPVKYLSRDPGIANVNASGMITAVSVGATYVVASVTDRPEVRDSIRVRVFADPPKDIPLTGAAVTGMEAYDSIFSEFMRKHSIPGGTVAVMREGKLIYARGFGYADLENKILAQPDALFRIASMSKPITSAAIFKLIEEGKLELDDRIAPYLADLAPVAGATVDPRWDLITVRQLLSHSGGWDRTKPNGGFDPIDRSIIAANTVGAPVPGSPETLVRYMKGMPLDFDPGQKFAYSNFGFAILGILVERLSGMPYEDYVRSRVLLPVGAVRSRSGRARLSQALPEEVKYYFPGLAVWNAPMVPSVFPGEGMVPFNYGGFHLEVGIASGAWVSSTIDLLRFLGGVDGLAHRPDILSAATITQMTSASNGAQVCGNGQCYYSGGWFVRPLAFDKVWWHGGTLPGSTGMLVRTSNNFAMAALFNTRHPNMGLETEIYDALFKALDAVTTFPSHDLFAGFR
jgi:CubicO group peptidase (beta-lactamase class C family)